MCEIERIVQLVHFVSGVRFLAGVRLVFFTSFRIRLFRTWAVHTKDGGRISTNTFTTGFRHMFRKPKGNEKESRNNTCTVIHLLWVCAKFGTCTVVSVNGTLVEAKMFTFTLESTHFNFNMCPIFTDDDWKNYRTLQNPWEVKYCTL